jgi:hypothetical protein
MVGISKTGVGDSIALLLGELAKRHTHRPGRGGVYNRCQAGPRALVEQSIGQLATAWSLRRWRGLLYRARDVFRAAAALISLGRWRHRLPA